MLAGYHLTMKFQKNEELEECSFTCATQRQADERQLNELIVHEQLGFICVEAKLARDRSRGA